MKKLVLLFSVMLVFIAACSERTESTNNTLSENAQSFSPHGAAYDNFVDFYNEMQDALGEELELGDIYTRFDELEEEKREIQDGLVEVTGEELADAADELLSIADAREETLDDESAVFDEIENLLRDAQATLDTVMTRGYSTQGDELMEVATERLEAQRAILDGKYEIVERERALYELFASDESTQEDIDEQSSAVSDAYIEVGALSDELGEKSDALNETLESLYEFMN